MIICIYSTTPTNGDSVNFPGDLSDVKMECSSLPTLIRCGWLNGAPTRWKEPLRSSPQTKEALDEAFIIAFQ